MPIWAQTIPARVESVLLSCADQGGWIDPDSGACLACSRETPERSGEDPLGDRACVQPKGYVKVAPTERLARVIGQPSRLAGDRCNFGETRRDGYCYRCPPTTIDQVTTCLKFRPETYSAALRLPNAACPGGTLHGGDGKCYACPEAAAWQPGAIIAGPAACHLDALGAKPPRLEEKWPDHADLRTRVLDAFGETMIDAPTPDPSALIERIARAERAAGIGGADFVLFLRPVPGEPGRSEGYAAMAIGRNPVRLLCYAYSARTVRTADGATTQSPETLIVGWGPASALRDAEMVGYVRPSEDLASAYAGFDWLKFPSSIRLVWDIGVADAGPEYYRYIQIEGTRDNEVDCGDLDWSQTG